MEVDVIVVGSGAAGLSAAIVAARSGLRVLVIESALYFGGTTAYSGGAVWVPNNCFMSEVNQPDSQENAERYLHAILGRLYDNDKIAAYLENAPAMLEYFQSRTAVQFQPTTLPDYESSAEGSSVGRTLVPIPFDGRNLGDDLANLRAPLPQMGFMGMQVDGSDIPAFVSCFRSGKSLIHASRLFAAYLWERFRHGRGMRIANGNALVARLLCSARECGVELWTNARAQNLVLSDGSVSGVIVDKGRSQITIQASKGVILATGGFGANKDMRKRYVPLADRGWSLQPECCQGDGIQLGIKAGGMIVENNAANAIWVPISAQKQSDGKPKLFPHAMLDRHCPGSIVVDLLGKRFVNEGSHYQHFGNVVRQNGIGRCFLIADHYCVKRYGLGLARPGPLPNSSLVRAGYIIKASSLGALAEKIGINRDSFERTVVDFNNYAEQGKDPDFLRGEDAYSAFMGDSEHTPNPSLGPLLKPPFYALELHPGEFSTICGLETDANACVLTSSGQRIAGLYAAGSDMNSIWRGMYPGGGAAIGPAMTFGFLAARHILDRHDIRRDDARD